MKLLTLFFLASFISFPLLAGASGSTSGVNQAPSSPTGNPKLSAPDLGGMVSTLMRGLKEKPIQTEKLNQYAINWSNWIMNGGIRVLDAKRENGPSTLDILFTLDSIFVLTGEFQRAYELTNAVMKTIPNPAVTLKKEPSASGFSEQELAIFYRCSTAKYIGRFEECEQSIAMAAKPTPNILLYRAILSFEEGKLDLAYSQFNQLMSKLPDGDPLVPWINLMLAQIKFYQGNIPGAEAYLRVYFQKINPAYVSDIDKSHAISVETRIFRAKGDFANAWRAIEIQRSALGKAAIGPLFEALNLDYEALLTAITEKSKIKIDSALKEIAPRLIDRPRDDFYVQAVSLLKDKIDGKNIDAKLSAIKKIRPENGLDYKNIMMALKYL